MFQALGQSIQFSVDVVQLRREGIGLGRRLARLVRQRQVKVFRQVEFVQRSRRQGRRLHWRYILDLLFKARQEVVIGLRRGRVQLQVQVKVRQVLCVGLRLGLLFEQCFKGLLVLRDLGRRGGFQVIQAQVEIGVEGVCLRSRGRLVVEQVLDVLRIQGCGGHCGTDTRRQHGHGREARLELLDLGMVLTVGHQLALLGDEPVLVVLQAIDFHQLQTQVTALGLALDGLFKHIRRLVQVATVDMGLGLGQGVAGIFLSHGNRQRRQHGGDRRRHNRLDHRGWRGCGCWRHCGGELDARRRHFKALEAVRRQVLIDIGNELRLFGQRPSHAQMLLFFTASIAMASP